MGKKIHILQLVEGFGGGGAEKKLLELVSLIDPKKFKITVCSLGLSKGLEKEFEKLPANVHVFQRKYRVDIRLILKVIKLIRSEKINVIMTTLFYADIIGILAGKLAGVKKIYTWETSPVPEWLLKRRLWSYRFVIRFCNRVVAVSEATAEFLREKRGVPDRKILVIPYGVDLKKYSLNENKKNRKEFGFQQRHHIIGVVARLHPIKGHRYLIEAAEDIIREFPDTRFVFAGDGELREDFENIIRTNKMENNFLLLGYRPDIHHVLKAIDIFVLPSLHEGLPNVVLEAMASGKPVVATNVGGSREAVSDNISGFLIPSKNVDSLKEALIKLLKDPALARQMGIEGRKRVEKYYSLEKQIEKFEKLFALGGVS